MRGHRNEDEGGLSDQIASDKRGEFWLARARQAGLRRTLLKLLPIAELDEEVSLDKFIDMTSALALYRKFTQHWSLACAQEQVPHLPTNALVIDCCRLSRLNAYQIRF